MKKEEIISHLDSLLMMHRGLLNDADQEAFYNLLIDARNEPEADEEGNEIPLPLELLRLGKILEAKVYRDSSDVKSVLLGGNPVWATPSERANYLNALNALEGSGAESVSFMGVTLPVSTGKAILAATEIYAARVTMVADEHVAAIRRKQKAETIEAYDYTVGYPERLSFDL